MLLGMVDRGCLNLCLHSRWSSSLVDLEPKEALGPLAEDVASDSVHRYWPHEGGDGGPSPWGRHTF